ncbi:MAG: serine/threonine-protein kinase [Myxococcales bacterium]|nr:serine/threonine-protein kinase [Myxococcales bacterium]
METVGSGSLVGRLIDDRYRIDALVGQGAAGAVYRAVERDSGRVLALKQWHRSALDAQVRGRFLREAKALDTLDHPNIVEVFGHGFVDDVPYVALEYLEGTTLESRLAEGPLAPEQAFDIIRQALTAIAYAHERSVVHRDLKPENIFLVPTPDGGYRVKILDYGLAKFMTPTEDPTSGGAALTVTGMMVGTPLYMPPEQAAGSSVDLQVDVYAMGCVLFEVLTGRPPFLGETHLELIGAHLRAPIPQLDAHLKDARAVPELQDVVDHALAKKQMERYPSARAMLEALVAVPQPAILPGEAAAEDAETVAEAAAEAEQGSLGTLVVAAAIAAAVAVAFALLR